MNEFFTRECSKTLPTNFLGKSHKKNQFWIANWIDILSSIMFQSSNTKIDSKIILMELIWQKTRKDYKLFCCRGGNIGGIWKTRSITNFRFNFLFFQIFFGNQDEKLLSVFTRNYLITSCNESNRYGGKFLYNVRYFTPPLFKSIPILVRRFLCFPRTP